MRNQKWRDQFIADATRAGVNLEDARKVLSKAATLQRLAEAQCNGDWPADNGQREVSECPRCACYWVPSTIKRTGCPDCRAMDAVRAIVGPYAPLIQADFAGDPRGCVVKLVTPEREIGVPS